MNSSRRWPIDQRFLIGSDGMIIGPSGHVLRPWTDSRGYLKISRGTRRNQSHHFVARIVLEAFVGPCPPGHEAAHGDGNRTNNSLANLRWATPAENYADKVRHGTVPDFRGMRHHNSTISDDDVREIRRAVALGESKASVGRRLGVSRSNVSLIALGKAWTHVTD